MVLIQLIVVATIDLKKKIISNYWPIANGIAAILLYLFLRDVYVFSWEVLLFPLGFLVVGFILFIFHIMGAGDSKYLSSVFLLLPLEYHALFFEKLLYSTMMVGGILFLVKVVKNFPQLKSFFLSGYWQGIRNVIKSRFSYAPVMLLAWILLGAHFWK